MTKRQIVIDLDASIGNKLYWFLKEIMVSFPDAIKEIKPQFGIDCEVVKDESSSKKRN